MKNHIFVLLALLAFLPFSRSFVQAQEIICTEFNPALNLNNDSANFWQQQITLDFDNDSIIDVRFHFKVVYHYHVLMMEPLNDWKVRRVDFLNNDTVVSNAPDIYAYNWWFADHELNPTDGENYCETMGAYKNVDGKNYYAWFHLSGGEHYINDDFPRITLTIDRMAFCTIPDYPLVWGQTAILGVDENEDVNFKLFPNPTNDILTLCGTDLQQVEVYDITGRRMLSKSVSEDEASLDMRELASGLYFVRVTCNDGKQNVRKVVKE